eukprot:609328-Prymnesium_polylepis.1
MQFDVPAGRILSHEEVKQQQNALAEFCMPVADERDSPLEEAELAPEHTSRRSLIKNGTTVLAAVAALHTQLPKGGSLKPLAGLGKGPAHMQTMAHLSIVAAAEELVRPKILCMITHGECEEELQGQTHGDRWLNSKLTAAGKIQAAFQRRQLEGAPFDLVCSAARGMFCYAVVVAPRLQCVDAAVEIFGTLRCAAPHELSELMVVDCDTEGTKTERHNGGAKTGPSPADAVKDAAA